MLLRYDPEADAVYIELAEPHGDVRTRQLDDYRLVDYDEADSPVGVELLFVSQGVDFDGLPRSADVKKAFKSLAALAGV